MAPKLPWHKSNKSQISVAASPGQPLPLPSVLSSGDNSNSSTNGNSLTNSIANSEQRFQTPDQYGQSPQRTTSTNTAHRQSAHHLPLEQTYQQQQQTGAPQTSPIADQPYQTAPTPGYVQEPKKASFRSRIAAGFTGHRDDDATKQATRNPLGRKQSVRKTGPEYSAQDASRLQASQWQQQPQQQQQQPQQRTGSSPHLPPSTEEDESNLDPFLQQEGRSPQVPPKDVPYQQHFQPGTHQEYARSPPEGVSGVHQQPPQPQQQPYQNYQPTSQHSSTKEYTAFNPQNTPSPLSVHAQLHTHDTTPQPQQYYQYQQNTSHPQQQSNQQQSPQSTQPQQQQQQQQSPTRQLPHLIQPDSLRPPSSQQQHAPPSPLQQAHDESHTQNTTPPQDNMAPSSQNSVKSSMRKVADGQQQPGPPTREPSLLQQPGQTSAQPPVSPGIASFGANVVPSASQGQPYRGDKQSQGEISRATPPPRSASDMTDESLEKMIKEHEVLREKYQKVKRYFFEQQTQVHQLQNTLANQRMSLSRTSWDDSEYTTRFNRLDGLIAQLSFSIRKDWRSIPPWLHVVVNKSAVETGKQEMTAVGRAFMSHWLVENIFEKYFHPDLDPGLSTQLQAIQTNIRRFAPVSHSAEDEDSLAAKLINWRLATLEGLADHLRAPQAEVNRQTLTHTLNEKLIASLQMYLNDPAPPDLNGGVPMIVELAISIAQHLPLESREVHIEYFPPGHGIVSDFMKMESGIPALTSPIADAEEADRASVRSVASKAEDAASLAEQEQLPKEDKKRGMFGFGKKPTQTSKRESTLGQGGSQLSLSQPPPSAAGPKDELPPRVRMAVGVAVQIRGKSILIKAPVYST
ncbi:hypothetical protein P153DRAFT_125180 [Dothidotthia symphoricarpi CBS 119687]|uniref:Uncharacterized protein n=1 Tax=Dothidotthia symphoricarpi CBS 119687 TaxID=1392245 RepID=A0A6A6A295_9PLEO|nr:uncharacterized protein P153DRAFT_125180 [Dothidotthia symphoricarpi CBS 119687]KAF2124701.1 hypothetical protein P153DRAFT_125180 [Dothidotthia symphoricarpi CBS 119687]